MPENKEYMTHQEELGTIQISEEVVASIASAAVQEVPDALLRETLLSGGYEL